MVERKLQPHEIAERAAEARNLLNSPLMKEIFDELSSYYIQQLVQAEVGSLTAATLHASMKVINDVQGRLQSVQRDERFLSQPRKRVI